MDGRREEGMERREAGGREGEIKLTLTCRSTLVHLDPHGLLPVGKWLSL